MKLYLVLAEVMEKVGTQDSYRGTLELLVIGHNPADAQAQALALIEKEGWWLDPDISLEITNVPRRRGVTVVRS